jgi:hypothetical protein
MAATVSGAAPPVTNHARVSALAAACRRYSRPVGRQADDGVGPEDAAAQRRRCVVLTHVHAVGASLEREVGPVVEDERDAESTAHA